MTREQKTVYEFNDFRLDPDEHLLLWNGQAVPLTPKVFETLVVFVRNRAHVLSKEELLKTLWPNTFVNENTLNRHISTLRKALGECTEHPKYIETIPKIGFRFIGDVREMHEESPLSTDRAHLGLSFVPREEQESRSSETFGEGGIHAETSLGGNALVPLPGEKTAGGRSRPRRLLLGLIPLLLLSAGGMALHLLDRPNRGGAIASIAVLPFVNVEGDSSTEYLADGITENLINNLSQVPSFKVISSTSVSRFKNQATDPVAVGRELNVAAVLTGKVVHHSDHVSINIELVDVADESQIWGQQFTRRLEDIRTLEEEISRVTLEKLQLKLTGDEKQRLSRRYPQSNAAYQFYLKGLYFRNKRTEEGMRRAIEYFEQAVEKDPNYGLAYAGMAYCYNWINRNGRQATGKVRPLAEAMAMKALAIDKTLGEAHMALADVRFTNWEWTGLEMEFQRAIELSPNNSEVHALYSTHLAAMGRFEEAFAETRRAQELDPFVIGLDPQLGIQFYMARQFDQAAQQFRQILDIDNNLVSAHEHLAEVYAAKGKFREALAEYQQSGAILGIRIEDILAGHTKAAALSGDGIALLARIARVYALAGDKSTGRKLLGLLQELQEMYVPRFLIARIYIGLGEYDEAFAWLEEAYKLREGGLVWLGVSPIYDPLRNDPRFQVLQRRIGLPISPNSL